MTCLFGNAMRIRLLNGTIAPESLRSPKRRSQKVRQTWLRGSQEEFAYSLKKTE